MVTNVDNHEGSTLLKLLQAVTLASAFNDVGSWALVSWQATFYQRVYELSPESYAPALAAILPVGGIIGGVGGGLVGDWLSRRGGLQILTAGLLTPEEQVLLAKLQHRTPRQCRT